VDELRAARVLGVYGFNARGYLPARRRSRRKIVAFNECNRQTAGKRVYGNASADAAAADDNDVERF
jgi:hypothetical protein